MRVSNDDQPDPSPDAQRALDHFAASMQAELGAQLATGLPYCLADKGRVVWVHPDGTHRLSADPRSPKA